MKKVFITGITGLLGRTIFFESKKFKNINIIGGYYPEKNYPTLKEMPEKYFIDIRNQLEIRNIIESEHPEIIINCASLANVDYVETHRDEAYQTNFLGTKNIVDLCRLYKIKLIHVSSNAVYDGNNPPYSEDSERTPINYYGKLKVMEEDYIMTKLEDFVIVRPILMYGWNDPLERENPFTWQLRMQKENKEILMVDDIYCNPLLANDCARLALKIADENISGIFNIAGPEILSRYEFSKKIAKYTSYNLNKIKHVNNSFFEEIAPRPLNTSFDYSKINSELDFISCSIEQGLIYLFKNKWE